MPLKMRKLPTPSDAVSERALVWECATPQVG
jgi:hypothetical protein